MDRNARIQSRVARNQEVGARDERGLRASSKTAQMNEAVDKTGYAYREDYGSEMTTADYDKYKGQETEWKNGLTAYDKQLSTAQGEINTARSNMNAQKAKGMLDINAATKTLDKEAKVTIDSLYKKEQSKWMNVRVVNGSNIEQTYKVPKSAIPSFAKQTKGYFQNYVDDGKYYNIDVNMKKSAGGGARGKEIHQALGSITKGVKESFYSKALKPFAARKSAITKQYSAINNARTTLIGSYNTAIGKLSVQASDIMSNKSKITNARSEHQASLDTNKKDYDTALKTRQALFASK